MGYRLMVGRLTLDQVVGVRIPVPQPIRIVQASHKLRLRARRTCSLKTATWLAYTMEIVICAASAPHAVEHYPCFARHPLASDGVVATAVSSIQGHVTERPSNLTGTT